MFQLKWVWKQLEICRKRYIFALCSTVLLSIMGLGSSLITANIMDTVFHPLEETGVVTAADTRRLAILVGVLAGFTLLRTGFGYLSILTYENCSQKVLYKLRRELYQNMQEQDQSFFGHNRTGDLMTRLTGDLDMVRHTVCWVVRMFIEAGTLFLAATVTFFVTDWLFTLCMLAVTPIIMLLTVKFSKTVRPMHADLRERLATLNTQAQENIAGNRVVKAFAREDYEIERFDEKNRDYRDASIRASMVWQKYGPFIDALSQSLSVVVLLVGGIFLISGRITIGDFTLFNSLSWTLSSPMRMIGMHINDLQRFQASAAKVIELYHERSTVVSPEDAVHPDGRVRGAVDLKKASLRLDGAPVLSDIDLHIDPGETVAIMGPTGSGKTSLINLIPRFTDPTGGVVELDGVPLKQYDLHDLRSAIGVATQDVFLFSDTVDGNIAYGETDAGRGDRSISREEVERCAKMADVDFVDRLPDGYDTVIGERGTGLSGGQKQRIALARALAIKPSVLILDDTTSAVDMETESYIQEQLDALDFPCTKIIVAQRISSTRRADRVVVIEDGRITEMGTHRELSQKPGYYRDVFLLQNGANTEREAS